jgi:hypothetical protein
MKNCFVRAVEKLVPRMFVINFMNFKGKITDFKYALIFLPGAYRFV